jgi:ATP synthase protein I
MDSSGKRQARRIVLGQFLVSIAVGAVLLAIGPVHGYSALAGGLIAATSNALFAGRVFADYRAQEPEKLLYRLYGAELGKLMLAGAGFAAVLLWVEPLSVGALFGAFLVVHLAPAVLSRNG